jgi:hypothetical protein
MLKVVSVVAAVLCVSPALAHRQVVILSWEPPVASSPSQGPTNLVVITGNGKVRVDHLFKTLALCEQAKSTYVAAGASDVYACVVGIGPY